MDGGRIVQLSKHTILTILWGEKIVLESENLGAYITDLFVANLELSKVLMVCSLEDKVKTIFENSYEI